MKKKYVRTEMEITEFDTEDVIMTSGTGEGGGENNDDGDGNLGG